MSVSKGWLGLLLVAALGVGGCAVNAGANNMSGIYGNPSAEIPAGTRVAAIWKNGAYYPGTVQGLVEGGYAIAYDDGDQWVAPRNRVLPMTQSGVQVGDHVLAVWKNGKMYPGRVSAVSPGGATISWDDGDTPMFVPEKNIAPIGGGGGAAKGKRPPEPYHAELIPPGNGWFCFSRPDTNNSSKPFSYCARQASMCETLHGEDAQKYAGVTPCVAVTQAWCHTYHSNNGKDLPVCVPTEAECVEEVDLFLNGKTPSSLCRIEP